MPWLREIAHDVQHLRNKFGIERRGDLIQQQQLRLHGQRPDDGDALLLAAGQAVGIFLRLRLEPDAASEAPWPVHRPPPGSKPRTLIGASVTFSMHAHMRKQIEALKDDADLAAQPVHIDARTGDPVVLRA